MKKNLSIKKLTIYLRTRKKNNRVKKNVHSLKLCRSPPAPGRGMDEECPGVCGNSGLGQGSSGSSAAGNENQEWALLGAHVRAPQGDLRAVEGASCAENLKILQ